MLIVDGHALAYRAFYALPESLRTPDGQPINAVYGFVSLLFSAYQEFNPHYVTVCFDRKEPTFRHQMYVPYKAHRPPAPESFKTQLPVLRQVLMELGIKQIDCAGYEADDLLGTLAHRAQAASIPSYIMTSDRDCFQLITDLTTVVVTKKGVSDLVRYDPKRLFEEYQLTPNQIVDFKALQGDASDNIPGVDGVGEKTALSLLTQFGNIDRLYQHLDQVGSEKLREKLKVSEAQARLSYTLATIDCHVPMDVTLQDCVYDPQWPQILAVFHAYQFKSLITKYQSKNKSQDVMNVVALPVVATGAVPLPDDLIQAAKTPVRYAMLDTLDAVKKLLPDLKHGFAVDLETTSLDIRSAQIVGVALASQPGSAYYIPLNTYLSSKDTSESMPLFQMPDDIKTKTVAFDMNPILALLKPLLEDSKIPKYTHNGKYEFGVLYNYGIVLKGIAFDTMLAAYLLYPGERLGLKELASRFLGVEMQPFQNLVGKGKQQIGFADVAVDAAASYAAADADMTYRLYVLLRPQIEDKKLADLLYTIEQPLQMVLSKMEYEGVCVDVNYLGALEKNYAAQLAILSKDIIQMAGVPFNLNSPKQLSEILFAKLKLPVVKKTKTGLSTDASVLEKLAPQYPIAQKLLEYRTLEKLMTTYIQALPQLRHPVTGRIHASFNQTVTTTGRLSSSNPNLQNIPIRSEDGGRIRAAFVPSERNRVILSADYSQIELRLIAHMAHDEPMIAAFKRGEDIHASTAAAVFNIPLSEVTKEQRSHAKAVNFGIVYGISAYGLSENLNIPVPEAKQLIDAYFARFSKIRVFIDETLTFAREHGYVRTEFGRIRMISDMDSTNKGRRQFAERAAVNSRVQGTAADMIKVAMVRIQDKIETQKLHTRMLIQVHDELVFDVPENELEAVKVMVQFEMTHVMDLAVPLVVDMGTGPNWLQA